MSEDVYNTLDNPEPLQPRMVRLNALNGTPLKVIREFYAKIRIGLTIFEFPVIVVRQDEALVIGSDFLDQYRAVIDYARRKIQLTRCDVLFIAIPPIIKTHHKLRLDEQLIVPAKCRLIYNLHVPEIHGSFSGLIKPNLILNKKYGFSVGRTISSVRNGHLPVELLNTSKHPIEISVGVTLGNLVPYENATRYSDGTVSSVREQSDQKSIDAFLRRFDFSKTKLSGSQLLSLQELLFCYQDLFDENEGSEMSSVPSITHRIEFNKPEVTPIRERIRRTTPQMKEVINKEIDKMLANHVIEPLESP